MRRERSSPPPVWARKRATSQSDAGYSARDRSPTSGYGGRERTSPHRERSPGYRRERSDFRRGSGYHSPPRSGNRERSPIYRGKSPEYSRGPFPPFRNRCPSPGRPVLIDISPVSSAEGSPGHTNSGALPFEGEPSSLLNRKPFESIAHQPDNDLPFQGYDEYRYVFGEESSNRFAEDNVEQFGNFKKSAKMFHMASTDFDSQTDEVPGDNYRDTALDCETCGIHVNSIKALQVHFAGARHRKELKRRGLSTDLTDTSTHNRPAAQLGESLFVREDGAFNCGLCGVILPTEDLFEKHLNGKKHQKRLKWTKGEGLSGGQHWCNICNVYCTDKSGLDTHYAGKQHNKMMKRKGVPLLQAPPAPLPLPQHIQQQQQPMNPPLLQDNPLSMGHFAELLVAQQPRPPPNPNTTSWTHNQPQQSTSSNSSGPKSDNRLGVAHFLKSVKSLLPPSPPPPDVVQVKCVACDLLLLSAAAIDEHTSSEEHHYMVHCSGLQHSDVLVPQDLG